MHIIKESRHGNTLLNNKCSVINKCLQLLLLFYRISIKMAISRMMF